MNKKISMFREFIKYGSNYLTFLKESKYISSFYVTRKININKDKKDPRRTYTVTLKNNKKLTINGLEQMEE